MERLLRWLEVKVVDACTRGCLLVFYDFDKIRTYRSIPVYAPTTSVTREAVFDDYDVYAFAMGEGIFVKYKSYARDLPLLEHEYTHVQQLREAGILDPLAYGWYENTCGYEGNPLEIEAEQAESRLRKRLARTSR